ncbi:MAG: helix-turn-helix domain-containing protein [Calditrichaeota bacterium]|nr:MAG: helix-turn-helix domain-containing protein [Calditrichota bacterium]
MIISIVRESGPSLAQKGMTMDSTDLRFILGFKLKKYRQEKKLSLKELAHKTNLSISYLSEIEKGKKYPKPEKLLQIARVLQISFDELVSLRLQKKLDSLSTLLTSPVLKEFPFQMFGISPRNLMQLLTDEADKAGPFLRTVLEIARTYDIRVEHLLFAALRAYQNIHENFFPEIESAAQSFRKEHQLSIQPPPKAERLQQLLQRLYGIIIDTRSISDYPELNTLRWVLIDNFPPTLIINPNITREQKTFLLARELGYRVLNLQERVHTSSLRGVQSFNQILNHYKASYFAGALLMPEAALVNDLTNLFNESHWIPDRFLQLIRIYGVTPETFANRLAQLLPIHFGIRELLFFRFHTPRNSGQFSITSLFNTSRFLIPTGMGTREHYCRRWLPIRLLLQLEEKQNQGHDGSTIIAAQRSRFKELNTEFFTITLARASGGQETINQSGTVSFELNSQFKKVVRFWDDPAIPVVEVNETCERCGFSEEECSLRAAPPEIYHEKMLQKKQEAALTRLKEAIAARYGKGNNVV